VWSSALIGFGLGFAVAATIGPISLLLIRTTLRGAPASGLAIGAGAAVIDTAYATLGALGAGRLLTIDALRVAIGVIGATVLAWIGIGTLWSAFRVRLGGEADEEVARPRRAFLTSLAATASNPLTILSWGAVFAAAATADAASTTGMRSHCSPVWVPVRSAGSRCSPRWSASLASGSATACCAPSTPARASASSGSPACSASAPRARARASAATVALRAERVWRSVLALAGRGALAGSFREGGNRPSRPLE
jgi:threonine/homoserine/homoserine lactone efflux protein